MDGNERISAPFGDVYLINTPNLDRTANFLYADQKQQEEKLAREAKALDDEFSKQTTAIREADIPKYVEKYQQYKNTWVDLQKSNPRNQKEYIAKQFNLNKLLAEAHTFAGKSIGGKKQELLDAQRYANPKNENDYEDNAFDTYQLRMNTPIDNPIYNKLGQDALYKGNKTKFYETIGKSVGTKKQLGNTIEIPVGTQTQIKKYEGIPYTANEIAANLLKQVVGAQMHRDLPKAFRQYEDPNEVNRINQAYDKLINSEDYQKAYKGKVLDFPPYFQDTPQGRIAVMIAKESVLANPPSLVNVRTITNDDKKREADAKEFNRRFNMKSEDSWAKMKYNIANNKPPSEGIVHPMDKIVAEKGITINVNGENKLFIPRDGIANDQMNLFSPTDEKAGVAPVMPSTFTMPDGTKKDGYLVNTNTLDWENGNGIISRDMVTSRSPMLKTKEGKKTINALNPNNTKKTSANKQKNAGGKKVQEDKYGVLKN